MSRFTDFTLEMCTPRLRWIPAHLMHRNIPKFQDAHLGPERDEKMLKSFIFACISFAIDVVLHHKANPILTVTPYFYL